MALGAAVGGPLATAAVLLHMLGHGLAKAAMFVVAGRILADEGSSRTADVTALLARRPDLARPLLAGTAALLGFPPFVLFFTEVAIIIAGWQAGLGWAMGIALALLLVAFAGLARHVSAMTLGEPTEPGVDDQPSELPAQADHPVTQPRLNSSRQPGAGRPRCSSPWALPPSSGSWPSPWPPCSARPPRSWQVPDEPAAPHPDRDPQPRPAAVVAGRLLDDGWRLALVAAHDDQGQLPCRLHASCAPSANATSSPSRSPTTTPGSPAWPALSLPAGRFEREIRDLYGIRPEGHPLPQRLVRHGHWPGGYHPMRHDADPTPRFEPRHRLLPVHPRRGRRRLRDPRRTRPRRAHRTRPLPLLRGRRDHPADQGPPVVRAPRRREAVRGPHPDAGHRAGRTDQRRHRRRARPGLHAGRRGRPRHRRRRAHPGHPRAAAGGSNGCTTTSATSARSPTMSATASPTPTPNACARPCCATTRP